ncbi:hypothetical protein L6164_025754 [Bauhinia variegata]|uniref:Uncharacterized protein n=1 Tax=Bauhinia variegata TaxID=167791 RepID=A0ACB9M1W2_BAUVA|nr:hypothetical protein L6164_025754 [Bauhinia variegata]
MFIKLQLLDTNCFPISGSTKTLPGKGVSVSVHPAEKFEPIPKKSREHIVPHSPNGGDKKSAIGRVQRHFPDRRGGVNQERGLKMQNFEENRDGEVLPEKVQSKCSRKSVSYGGCIPEILEALNTIHDLDEALRPWKETLSNKERSIILKEQVRWERALEIFEWFKRKGCYELNVIHYNIMFRTLGKAQKWSHVESLWNEMRAKGVVPINSTYGTLIDVYRKGELKEKALLWLERMQKQGMEPDEVTMGIVVQLYKKAGEFQKAEDFFRKWSLGQPLRLENNSTVATSEVDCKVSHINVCLSSHTYNTLIDTYGKAGQLQEASETLARMIKEGIAPTTVTFNTIIHVYGNHGKLDEVSSLLQKMEALQCQPDTRTYNILISLHTKHNDVDMAAKYLAKMKEACVEPDLVSYRTLLYAYSIRQMVQEAEELIREMDERGLEIDEFTQSALTRMYIEAGMLERSWLWFMRFHTAGNMTSECYSANIDAYGEHGHTFEAEKIFNCCQERKNHSVLEFNVMIKAYGIGKLYEKACQVFDNMEKHGVVADKCSYSSLIQILASADKPHIAKPYLKKMQEEGLVSDCILYCAVMSSFANLGQLEMAEGLYKEMIKYKVQPDIIVFGVLINAFADAGSVKEAICYVDEMKRAGLTGNTIIYNSLIKLYTKVGYLKEAQETYKLLQSSEEGPSVYSSNCMVDLYTKRCMVEEAEEIFESLKRNEAANEFSFAMMLCMYKKIGRLEEAIQIVKQMRKTGLLTDLLSYNNVLGLYAVNGSPREAVETFKEMIEAGIQPDDCTFRSLGIVLLKCGLSKKAVGRLEVTSKRDAYRGLQAWMSALSCVLEVDDYDSE